MKNFRIIFVVITITVSLCAILGILWYSLGKTIRLSKLRMEAREAYAAEDWKTAEKLLNEYTAQHDSEEELVRLAMVYRHFGSMDEEMRCWHRASMLNPLKPEYWDTYIECALKARNFPHLYTSLSHKINLRKTLAPREKMLYLISSVMMARIKEAEEFYEYLFDDDPEIFQEDDLSRYADFLITHKKLSPGECSAFLEHGIESDNFFVQLESILFYLDHFDFSGEDEDYIQEQIETVLKHVVVLNRFVGIPLLASFYYSNLRFDSVIEIAEPYLADIEHVQLAVIYAESCVCGAYPEKLKFLSEYFRSFGSKYRMQVSYFDALYDFSLGAEYNDDLARNMQDVGTAVQTDFSNLINLQIALNTDSMEKICSSLEAIMLNPPFYDLQERARPAVRHYLWTKIKANPELADNPGRLARLAQLIAEENNTDPFLMRIIIADLYKKDLLTRQILQENLNAFPVDPYLLQVAAEFELFNGNPERCLEYTERFYLLKGEKRSVAFDLLHAIALEQLGKLDEAAKEYAALVDNTEMDRGFLYRYFRFCIDHKRRTELSKMADRLSISTVPELKQLVPFFQSEELLLQEKKEEALSLLETAETDQLDFALHAANRFSAYDVLDRALPRYIALLNKHPDRQLIFANIAEVFSARGMKEEAISYARQSWEANQDDGIGQFVYAKMLVADGRYQDAERVLRIPYREVKLPDEVKELWTDIMLHCVREDLANRQFPRALDRSNHYLILYPKDSTFHDFKMRSEEELQNAPDYLIPGILGREDTPVLFPEDDQPEEEQ